MQLLDKFSQPWFNVTVILTDTFTVNKHTNHFQETTDAEGKVIFRNIPRGIYIQKIISKKIQIEHIIKINKDETIKIQPLKLKFIASSIKLTNFMNKPVKNRPMKLLYLDDTYATSPVEFNFTTNNYGIALMPQIYPGKYLIEAKGRKDIIELSDDSEQELKLSLMHKAKNQSNLENEIDEIIKNSTIKQYVSEKEWNSALKR
jgi:hypothetical protein